MEQENKIWTLEEVHEEKDLGVFVADNLKQSLQCQQAARKAMYMLGLINRHFKKIDIQSFKILYKCYIRPHMEYCIQAWSPYLRRDIDCLEKVQRRATKLVTHCQKLSYDERLKVLDLLPLEKRRLRGDLIETYKILTGLEDVDPADFFEFVNNGYDLRGHKFKLTIKRNNLNVRSKFFSQRIVSEWNGLYAR